MESVDCKHIERIEEFHGYALGTCTQCGQIRRYDRIEYKKPPSIIKIGRINGVQTMEHPPKESKDMTQNAPEATSIAQNEPEPVKSKRRHRLPRYCEDNKEGIIQDYNALTLKEFYAKQRFSSTTWTALKKKWGVRGKWLRKAKTLPDTKVTKVHKGNPLVSLGTYTVEAASELPDFPAFDSAWPVLTQIEWLQTYKALKEMEAK